MSAPIGGTPVPIEEPDNAIAPAHNIFRYRKVAGKIKQLAML